MNRISVFIAAGEGRAEKIIAQIEKDKAQRFEFAGYSSEIPGDIQFVNPEREGLAALFGQASTFNVELKDFTGKGDENSDLMGSILNGHLYQQTLQLRRAGYPCAIVVLGDEKDLENSILNSVCSRGKRGDVATDLMISYQNMVFDFEANCRGQNIGVWWLKKVPFKRLLSNVYHILTEADLSGYAPKPLAGEEQSVGLSILAGDGIGKAKADSILEHFRISMQPRHPDCFLDDCNGIGPKLAQSVATALSMPDAMIHRPKVRKSRQSDSVKTGKVTA